MDLTQDSPEPETSSTLPERDAWDDDAELKDAPCWEKPYANGQKQRTYLVH